MVFKIFQDFKMLLGWANLEMLKSFWQIWKVTCYLASRLALA